jgi:polysaccharide biosynthesis transport protein
VSRFYDAMQKVATGDDPRPNKSLGVGDTPVTVRRETPTAAVVLRPEPAQAPEKKGAEWLRGLYVISKYWRLSAVFASVLMVTVVVVTYSMKPTYEPLARIEVDPPGEQFSLEGGAVGSDSEYLETQAQNLKSDKLAMDVIHRLHLDQNPAMINPNDSKPQAEALAAYQLSPGEYSALHSFRTNLKVKRDTASRLISVSFASHDPKMAALVTNTVVAAFIDDTYRDQHDAIMKSTEWLSRQLDDIRARMQESNRVLAEFQKSIGVADVDSNKSTFTERMTELSQQLTQAQADRIQLEALLKSVQAGSPDVLPEIRNNPVVQQLSTKLAEQRGELSQARVIYGPNHPNVKKLQSQVDELQSQLEAQKAAVLGSIRTSYSAARARENLMDSQIKGASSELSQMARYNDLKKEAQANSELYNNLYARVKEAGIAAASKSSNLRVIDEAHVLDAPTRPNRSLAILIGMLAALAGGIGLAFLREQFDTRIFTPEDVRDWIGPSNVAVVPFFFAPNGKQLSPVKQEGLASGNSPLLWKLPPGAAFLLDRPHSPEAEALRSLYTSVMLSRVGNPPQILLVVSSLPGEGKTTVAMNLAMAMAQHGSTCLVDADLRRGRLATALGVSNHLGLTDVLTDTSPLDAALVQVPSLPNLTILPAHAGSTKAGELMCSDRMPTILADLRKRFQFVVIDSAPILPFADGRLIANLADGLIFVGRSGITTREVVQRSLQLLHKVHAAEILEFVLNAADLNSPQYRYHQYGYDYYERATKQDLA